MVLARFFGSPSRNLEGYPALLDVVPVLAPLRIVS